EYQVVVIANAPDAGTPSADLVKVKELPELEAAHPERTFLIDDVTRAQAQLREKLHAEYGDFEPATLAVVGDGGVQTVTLQYQIYDDSPNMWLRWRASRDRVEGLELKKVLISPMYLLFLGLESYGFVFLICGAISA